jgi:hypothetical protein
LFPVASVERVLRPHAEDSFHAARRRVRPGIGRGPAGDNDPVKVLDYLGRYIFSVAIANSRLEQIQHGQVTFRYRVIGQHGRPAAIIQRFRPHSKRAPACRT